MALTKEQRDAMPDEMFAVPGKRLLPIHDERHVRMAWSQLPRTQGITVAERKEARGRILTRAKHLGIDTTDWEVHAISFRLEAMALAVPDVPDHPNRMPFRGVLTRVDEPSDEPPGGAGGKCVEIPKDVAEAALPSLLGMAIDYTENFDGHDKKSKIGVITEATISGNAVNIAGFLYASDFPEECARIQAEKNQLGFSYECKVAISDMDADPWVVTRIIFTGAAVLYKDKAAYHTTSLAAQAEKEDAMTPEELKKLNDSIAALTASVGAIGEKVVKIEAKQLEAGKGASLAGPIIDQVQPHVVACNAAADAMEAAGVGNHPTRGHASAIRKVAAHLAAAAVSGQVPHIYRDHDYLPDARVEAGADKSGEAVITAAKDAFKGLADELRTSTTAELKKVSDSVAELGTKLADLQAKAFNQAEGPGRKTHSPEVTALLAKMGVKDEEAGKKLNVAEVDKTLEAAGIKGPAAMAAKMNLQAAGLIA
jgi:hypothetical protein